MFLYPSVERHRATCGWPECVSKNRSQNRIGWKWSNVFKKNQSMKITEAYEEGRMKHMNKVWRKNKERWLTSENPRWRPIGSTRPDGLGYILIKIQEGKKFKNWMPEHRFIMEQHLGRKLSKKEVVHHINHNKSDNRLSNLRLMTSTEHKSLHAKEKNPRKICQFP